MLSQRDVREMLIALGVAAGVVAVATVGLLVARPVLFPQAPPVPLPVQVALSEQPCTVDRKTVFETTNISREAYDQFVALQKQRQIELVAEKKRIEATGPTPEKAQQMIAELQQRLAAENARLEEVRASAMAIIIKRVSPLIAQASDAARCSSIIDRANFVYVGRTRDLTPEVVRLVEQNIPPLEAGLVADLYKKQK